MGGLGGTRWRTIVIAASDTHNKSGADYVCSGTSDEATINRAITDLEAHASSASLGRIVLLEGNYTCSGRILINALGARVLAIEGMSGNSQSDNSVGGTRINSSETTNNAIDIAGAGGDVGSCVIIENIELRSASTAAAIGSRDMTIKVNNCRITNTAGDGITQSNSTGGSSNTVIDNNYVTAAGGKRGISVSAGPTRGNVSYVRNNVVNISGAGTGIQTGNDLSSTPSYHVSDNTVYSSSTTSSTGIQFSGTSTQNNVCVDNFVFKAAVGISMAGYKNIIANNLIEQCPIGIRDGAFQLDASFIVGNHIIDPSTVGITIGTQNCTRNGILGNKVVGYATTVPLACQVNGLAVGTHVYYNDFDSGVTTPISDSGSGTLTAFGIPSGGSAGQLLAKVTSASGDVAWVTDYVQAAISAAGDLIVGTGANAFTALHKAGTLPMGPTWSQRILVDTSDAPGVKWGPTVTVGTVAPTSPQPGDIWLDTT